MAHIVLSAASTLAFFNRGARQLGKVFPPNNFKTNATTSLGFASLGRRWGSHFVASGMEGKNTGTVEIPESEMGGNSYAWPNNQKPRVCILGGGFGGLYTALRLESLEWPEDKRPQVVLIDQCERFVFKPMLYELLSGEVDTWEIAPRFSDLLGNTSVKFFQDKVKFLHHADHFGVDGSGCDLGGTVHLESGLLIEYDWLVLALGAEAKLDVVPGAAEYALPFSTLEDVHKVENKLRTLERQYFGKGCSICVAVVGCGYAGVELAATISERLQNKGIVHAINVETTICPTAPSGNREAALKVLQSRNVQLLLGYVVRCIRKSGSSETIKMSTDARVVQDIEAANDSSKLFLELQPSVKGLQSQILEADLVLWTVGSKPALPQLGPCEKSQDLPFNARGQAETDETLRVKGHPRVFAIGDSSSLRDSSGKLLPATAQVAFQQADFAGWNLWAAINDRPLLPFRFQNLGEMMTLGRNDAAISPTFVDGLTLDGPIGHTARKIAYLIRLPTDEHRLKVGISWLTKFAIDSVASLQNTVAKVMGDDDKPGVVKIADFGLARIYQAPLKPLSDNEQKVDVIWEQQSYGFALMVKK